MRTRSGIIAAAACVLAALAAGSASAGPIVIAPNGSGGFNAYQHVAAGQTYGNAQTAALATAFPGIPGMLPGSATTAHLASFSSEGEFTALGGIRRQAGGSNAFVGLTDDPTFAAGAAEFGNTSGKPTPANGGLPDETSGSEERGAGYRFVDGANFFFHQRSGTSASIWGGGEPNNSGDEDAAELRGDGLLNDIPVSQSRPYIMEWDLNLASRPHLGPPTVDTGNWTVREVSNVGTQIDTTGEAVAWLYANDQSGAGTAFEGESATINFSDPDASGGGGDWGGDSAFLSDVPGIDDNDFALVANARILIPDGQGGDYTFRLRGDDGGMVRILGEAWTKINSSDGNKGFLDGDAMIFDDPTGNANLRGVINLDPGVYDIEVIWFERGGGGNVELQAAKGDLSSGNMPLVGDVANGGIALAVPEPVTIALAPLAVAGLGGYLRRRRRA